MDLTLAGNLNTFSFKDNILIVTHGIEKKNIRIVKEVQQRLNEANIEVKLDKIEFAADTIELVVYELSQQSLESINSKGKGISERTIEAHKPEGLTSYLGHLLIEINSSPASRKNVLFQNTT